MAYATAQSLDRSEIPLIDISALRQSDPDAPGLVAQQMLEAAKRIGFFYVVGHGVDPAVFQRANRFSREFFSSDDSNKASCTINDKHRGHLRIGEARMYAAKNVDLKESFVFGLELDDDDPDADGQHEFLGHNQWPRQPGEFRSAMIQLFDSMSTVAVDLMRAFAVSMDLPEQTFIASADRPVSRGSSVYYPPQPKSMGSDQFGVAPHTDYGCLTLVWQDDSGGLEVRRASGDWVTAVPVEDSLVVNVGDLLARWTNDRFQSTPHRVVNRSGHERCSMALFWDPNFDTVIDPAVVCSAGETPKYDAVTVGDYVLQRYAEAFSYRARS